MGTLVQEGWKKAAESAGLPLEVSGMKPMSHFAMRCDSPQAAHTYFTQAMLARGFLASPDFYATFAHSEKHVTKYLRSCEEVFGEIAVAIKEGTLQQKISGEAAKDGFKRYA